VRLVRSVVYNSKTITYEALRGDLDTGPLAEAEEEWSERPVPQLSVVNLVTDAVGNVYALSGKTVEKRNADGRLLWSFAVPVGNSEFTLGPLVIDKGDLALYTAVDGGTHEMDGAAIFKIKQQPIANSFDTEPALGWAWQVDKKIRELRLYNGTLKCLLQNDLGYRSEVMTLVNINLAIPAEQGSVEVPYPSTSMAVKTDGSIITGHPVFADRDTSPLHPGVGISLEQWTSKDLTNYETRVWAELRASDLTSLLGDGDPVNFWPDRTGNGRNLTLGDFPAGGAPGAPTLREIGSTGLPSVFFDGAQGLFSPNGGGTEAQKGACKSLVPNHGDGAYCIVIVCRPSSQKTPGEKDSSGADIDATRWLFQQFTHTAYGGNLSANADTGYTEAHRSGIVVNSAPPASSGSYHYSWSGEWNGKNNKLGTTNSPGYLHAFTPSSGSKATSSTSNGSSDFALMPANKGAGWAGWPKEGQYDDPDSTTDGEGLCVITFMNCGGLDEAFAVTGTYVNDDTFTADSGTPFGRYPVGATGVIHAGSLSDTVTVASATELTLGSSNIATASAVASHVVWERNFMTRSMLTINGHPIDRWEALPMSYNGPGNSGGSSRSVKLNVEQHPTGVGFPITKSSYTRGFLGEIMEIEVFGRRQSNSDRVALGGTNYVLYPSLLTHPMYAENGHTGDDGGDDVGGHDKKWENIQDNTFSTELEKIVGEKMHRHGISNRLQVGGETVTQADATVDAAAATTTTALATVGRRRVKIVVAAVSGDNDNHILTIQTSPDSITWTDTTITIEQLGNSNGTVVAAWVRAKVTTVEGAASSISVTITVDGYPHPHYPAAGSGLVTYDLPLVSLVTDTGQAWLPRKRSTAAMVIKHDQAGKMVWCLLSDIGAGGGFGDIFSEDYFGSTGVLGVTGAPCTGGLALTSTGDIYVAGPGSSDGEEYALGIITDAPLTADNPRLTSVGFWRLAVPHSGADVDSEFRMGFASDLTIRLVVDEFDNVYVPIPPGTQYLGADAKDAIRIFGRAELTDGMRALIRLTTLRGTTKYQNAYAVALPPSNPIYSV
jgi:hypothetical protein